MGWDGTNPHKVLGVEPSASAAELETAFHERMDWFDPKKFAGDVELQRAAEAKQRSIRAAYAALVRAQKAKEGPPRRGSSSGFQILWCWRCQMDIPMLDEVAFLHFRQLEHECSNAIPVRRDDSRRAREPWYDERYAPLFAWYERLTGFRETNVNALWHHRVAQYGPPCTACKKPLRTPRAKLCAACGAPRAAGP